MKHSTHLQRPALGAPRPSHLAKFPGRDGPHHATRNDVRMREARLDAQLAASFPASDPPCWTLGRHA